MLLCEVLKRCLLHRLSQYSMPLRGSNSTEITASPHHVVPALDPARGFRECLLLDCFTYRAEEIQRKRGNSCYHTREGDGSAFCCLRKPMTSHRVEPYHLPDSLYVLMDSFVLSCRHFGPARLNIALVLTLHDFKTKNSRNSRLVAKKNILIYSCQFFTFFSSSHSSPPCRSTAECLHVS